MTQSLIIVESPAKARTISRLLGKGYVVTSSIGHIRDLPSRPNEIPASHRKKSWARTGVDVENGFKPLYVVPTEKKAQVKKLKELLAEASTLYLATDEDREGEAIAWHLIEVLKPKIPVKRMVFHEITKRAIEQALANPREVDRNLVDAQEARRILDRLYGYEVSPILWRKVRPRLSAGRVQSVATRLVVAREQQRMRFHSAAYCGLTASLCPEASGEQRASAFEAELVEVAGRRVAVGRHFDPATGELSKAALAERVLLLDPKRAEVLEQALQGQAFAVAEVIRKPFTQRPHPPFITSTLQQEASRKLSYTAQRTMRVAQRLYESGYITYMRTDSTTLSQEALKAARQLVAKLYGEDYLPASPRLYTKKVKGAQEAHEAIRPAGEVFRTPESLRGELEEEGGRLYELIWKRAMASQMKDATGERTQVRIRAAISSKVDAQLRKDLSGEAIFTASGKTILFPGYLRAYVEGADDPEAELEDKERVLPAMADDDALTARALQVRDRTTLPPARYTEASLVRELEERGIGRPSTYAAIIQTIQDRGYVWKQGNALVPTLTAFAVVKLLTRHFEELVGYEFTARMESDLDAIGGGDQEATPWLERFYYGAHGRQEAATDTDESAAIESEQKNRATLAENGLVGLIGTGVEHIDARDVSSLEIGRTPEGETLAARVGRYGPYVQIGDTDQRASIADDVVLDELDADEVMRLLREAELANRPLGVDPESGKTVHLKTGSYGPYVQLGEPELTPKGNIKKGSKPKMASLWPSMSLETITLEEALTLLSFPRQVGVHPQTGTVMMVQDGKFGPYLSTEAEDGKRDSRSLESHDQLLSITLEQAVALFAQPRQTRRRQAQNTAIAQLEKSPVTGTPIEVREGRFGPYVTDGQVNATIPRGRDPHKVTFDDALELIASREQRMRDEGKDPRAPKKTGRPGTRRSAGRGASARNAAKARGGKKGAGAGAKRARRSRQAKA